MDKSLFQFIWKNSKRNQFVLLAITVLTFPLLYISLELPKRIINDAIGDLSVESSSRNARGNNQIGWQLASKNVLRNARAETAIVGNRQHHVIGARRRVGVRGVYTSP